MKLILTWLLFIGVIAVNALANILPINGYNTGQIAAFYPNRFVPAGFTFSIWGVIYSLLLIYTITYSYFIIRRNSKKEVIEYINKVHPYYLLTCVFNMAWIIAWHYLQIEASVVIMLLFLSTLIQLFSKSRSHVDLLTKTEQFLLNTPFIVYLGWISVATIANITALFVAYQWGGFGIDPVYWSAIMISIASFIGIVFIRKYKSIAFPSVLIWALMGINVSQGKNHPILFSVSFIAIVYLFLMTSITLYYNYKKNKIA